MNKPESLSTQQLADVDSRIKKIESKLSADQATNATGTAWAQATSATASNFIQNELANADAVPITYQGDTLIGQLVASAVTDAATTGGPTKPGQAGDQLDNLMDKLQDNDIDSSLTLEELMKIREQYAG